MPLKLNVIHEDEATKKSAVHIRYTWHKRG